MSQINISGNSLPIISQNKKLVILNPSMMEIKVGGAVAPYVSIYVDGKEVFTTRYVFKHQYDNPVYPRFDEEKDMKDWMETANQKCFNIVTDYLAESRSQIDRASWFDFDDYDESEKNN